MKAPNLNIEGKHQSPFTVPDGYFDSLTARVMKAVDERANAPEAAKPEVEAAQQQAEGSKRVPFFKSELYAKLKPYIYMAAMFGGLYFGMWVYKYQQRLSADKALATAKTEQAQSSAASATDDEVYDYINDACDFMMADSHDIIACVTGDEQ